ncbi:diacylglycerol kinase family lipid kinase [Actinomadura craniellae]|uniref:Diacylglycerol kinase family lipid kinase n=1 Tax=Actinomadura craniellae TaxID=2231787 RepID=A0A365H6H0_9ACTN|nr:YegS/Rv2252/BmrU family lipid kinase [Actinomadura craniellae]RAY14671.1 diacylglycerol kinase family lipid kinase [Actinomadura craniellae]
MTRRFTAVVNPAAGGSTGTVDALARLLRAAGAEVEVEPSRGLEHAREVARRAAERGRVVLGVGGDGMVGCVGGALAGTEAVFGIVPAGRGNDFARALGLPDHPAELAALLLGAEPRRIDAIELTSARHPGVPVLGSVYAGVDALANHYANRSRLLRGGASYYVGGMRAVATWRPAAYQITVDGQVYERRAYTVVAANSGYYGFGRRIAPAARVDDGLLDVVVIRAVPRPLFFAVMNELKRGTHVNRPQVETLRGREITIAADRDLRYGADGEVGGTLPVTARVLPGALNVLCEPPPPVGEPG